MKRLVKVKDTFGDIYFIDPDKVLGLMPYVLQEGVLKKRERDAVLIVLGFENGKESSSPVGIEVYGAYLAVAKLLGFELYEPGQEVIVPNTTEENEK